MLFNSPFQVFVNLEGVIDSVRFESYQRASDFAHDLVKDRPVGKVAVVGPHPRTKKPAAVWTYERLTA